MVETEEGPVFKASWRWSGALDGVMGLRAVEYVLGKFGVDH
jgi:hypothetical protein